MVDVFVSKLPGPLTMHIAAFTGLYIIVGCLGETAMCSRRVERRFDRTRFGRKRFVENKSTVLSFNQLLGTSGKTSLCPGQDTELVPYSQACSIQDQQPPFNKPINPKTVSKAVVSPPELTTL